jgi:hypothetical protein
MNLLHDADTNARHHQAMIVPIVVMKQWSECETKWKKLNPAQLFSQTTT